MAEEKEMFMFDEDDIITLEYDNGEEVECASHGVFEVDGKAYIAFDTPEELDAKRQEIKRFISYSCSFLSGFFFERRIAMIRTMIAMAITPPRMIHGSAGDRAVAFSSA